MKKNFLIYSISLAMFALGACSSDNSSGMDLPDDDNLDGLYVADGGEGEVPPPYDGIAFDLGSPESPPDGYFCKSHEDCWEGWLCDYQGGEHPGRCRVPPPTDSPWFGACDQLDCEPSAYCYLDNGYSVCAPECDLGEAEMHPEQLAQMECLGEGLVHLCDSDSDCDALWSLKDAVCRHDFLSTESGKGVCLHPFSE